jgi:glycosyltransferase involved in cell wall biosynthesis
MQNTDFLLSICFPTYNRSKLLEQSVEVICEQISQGYSKIIEIVIVDNNSLDETYLTIGRITQKYKNIEINYFKRDKNIGTDNVIFCTEFAKGKYVFIHSDDDILIDGSLKHIIADLTGKSNIKSLTINSCTMTPGGKINTANKKFYIRRNIINPTKSISYLSTSISFLSSVIYRRNDVSLVLLNDYKGNQVIQCFAFIQSLCVDGIHVVDPQPMIAYRESNTKYDWFEVFTNQFLLFLNHIDNKKISNLDIFSLKLNHYFFSIIPHIMMCKTDKIVSSNFNFDKIQSRKKINLSYPFLSIFTNLIFSIPDKYIVKIYLRLKKIKNFLTRFR